MEVQIEMRFITGKKPCFWGFMGNLVIVKNQSSLIYVPDLDKYDAVSKFPLLFFSLRLFSFRQEFWEVRCGFHLLKLYCLECKLFRSGFFFPYSFYQNGFASVCHFLSLLFPLLWDVPLPCVPSEAPEGPLSLPRPEINQSRSMSSAIASTWSWPQL